MNVQRRISYLMGAAVLFATASIAQQVKTDYDRSTDFSQYKTYCWGAVHTEDALWVDRIKAAVNSALASKGLTQVETGGNVAIMAMEMTESRRTLNTYYDNFGGGWRWGDGFGDATTTENIYKVGTLVVDLFDSNTKKLIWRASASDALSRKSDKNIKNLDKGVAKMFAHFPPDTHKSFAHSYTPAVPAVTAFFAESHPAKMSAATGDSAIRPFRVNIPETALADLGRRIATTRWPDKETVTDRSQGVQLAKFQPLVRYWGTDYDWAAFRSLR